MLVFNHRLRRMRLLWCSFISEVCVESAKTLTMRMLLPNASKLDQQAVIPFGYRRAKTGRHSSESEEYALEKHACQKSSSGMVLKIQN